MSSIDFALTPAVFSQLEEDRERLISAGILPPSHTDNLAVEIPFDEEKIASPTRAKAPKAKPNAKKSKNHPQQSKGITNGKPAVSSSPRKTTKHNDRPAAAASPRKGAHARADSSRQANEHVPKPRSAPAPAPATPSPPASPAVTTIAAQHTESSPVYSHAQSPSPRSLAEEDQRPLQQASAQHVPVHVQPSPSAFTAAPSHVSTPEQHVPVQVHASAPVPSTTAQHVPVQAPPSVVQPSPHATSVMFGADSMYSWDQALPAPSSPTPLEGEESFWAEIHEV